ncbi:MAG: hypothetical protein GXY25_07065 [Pirellulaceae bacterium]|nr:hypothetical protein [Pirellulaceae bacterium]
MFSLLLRPPGGLTVRERRILVIVAGLAVGLAAAAWWVGHGHGAPGQWTPVARPPRIRPDYRGAVIPPNIAPLNFVVEEPGTACYVRVAGAAEESLAVRSRDGGVQLPPGPWKALLAQNRGKPLSVETYVRDHDRGWQRFEPIRWDVAEDEIDPYLAYRVLDAVYDYYKYVGIYQRHLESHDETSLLFNSEFNRGCVNCHSFLNNRPETCLVHSRPGADESIAAGPILVRDGKAARVKTRTKAIPRVAFVTSWHPSGNLAAFCVNWFGQFMRATGAEPREVVDLDSDVQIVDFRTGGISTAPGIADPDRLETFPSWSPDGKYLFFSSAPRLWEKTAFAPLKDFKQAKYDLMRIPYDPDADTWGEPELLLSAAETGKSILQPRPSPDGRYLLFCMCDHGPFPAFQEDSDLCLMDLADRSYRPLEKANSPRSESWHSWSSNSRWIVFSSRRDGLGWLLKVL